MTAESLTRTIATMSDMDVLVAFEGDAASRGIYKRVLIERMHACMDMPLSTTPPIDFSSICDLLVDPESMNVLLTSMTLKDPSLVYVLAHATHTRSRTFHERVAGALVFFLSDHFSANMQDLKLQIFTGEEVDYAPILLMEILRESIKSSLLKEETIQVVLSILSDMIASQTHRLLDLFAPGYYTDSISERESDPAFELVFVYRRLLIEATYILTTADVLGPSVDTSFLVPLWTELEFAMTTILRDGYILGPKMDWLMPLVHGYIFLGRSQSSSEDYCARMQLWRNHVTKSRAIEPMAIHKELSEYRWGLRCREYHLVSRVHDVLVSQCPGVFGPLPERWNVFHQEIRAAVLTGDSVIIDIRRDHVVLDSVNALAGIEKVNQLNVQWIDRPGGNNVMEWVTLVTQELVTDPVLFEHSEDGLFFILPSTERAKLRLLGIALGTAIVNEIAIFPHLPESFFDSVMGLQNLASEYSDDPAESEERISGRLSALNEVVSGVSLVLPPFDAGRLSGPELSSVMDSFNTDLDRFRLILSFSRDDIIEFLLDRNWKVETHAEAILNEMRGRIITGRSPQWPVRFSATTMIRFLPYLDETIHSWFEEWIITRCDESLEFVFLRASDGLVWSPDGRFARESFLRLVQVWHSSCDPRNAPLKSAKLVVMGIANLLRGSRIHESFYDVNQPHDPVNLVRRKMFIELILLLAPGGPATTGRFTLDHATARMWDYARLQLAAPIEDESLLVLEPALMSFIILFPSAKADFEQRETFCATVAQGEQYFSFYATAQGEDRPESYNDFWQSRAQIFIDHVCVDMARKVPLAFRLRRLRQSIPDTSLPMTIINVRRTDLFEDTFQQRNVIGANNMIRIQFDGEEASDAGGITREWFSILVSEMVAPSAGLFRMIPGTQNVFGVMINSSTEYMRFAGKMVARAILDEQALGIRFANSVYRHVLGEPVGLADLESEDPVVFASLQRLLEFDAETIESVGMNFEWSDLDSSGASITVDLRAGQVGADTLVTIANRNEYVNAVAQYLLVTKVFESLNAFSAGFHELIPSDLARSLLRIEDLQLLSLGTEEIDAGDFIRNMQYASGYTSDSTQIAWLNDELRQYTSRELKMLLGFVTGSPNMPQGGLANLKNTEGLPAKISVHKRVYAANVDTYLPTTSTCYFMLNLPEYSSKQILAQKLKTAITEASVGFGM